SRIGAGAGQVSVATNGVGAGAAAAVNGISSTVAAVIEHATVSSSQGAIAVKADAAGEIDSYAMGVAGAFGGEIVQFAGVGSGTGNTLTRQVTAAVRSRSTLESKGLSVMATDTSKINSAAGTVAIQYSKNPDISVAVGISASTNTVGSTTDAAKRSFVEAVVSDSTVTTHGSMEVSAKAQLAIQSITAAGAFQFSGGGGPVFGIAGAGAGSGNTVQMDVSATVRDASVIQAAAGDVVVKADNETSVTAISGGVAVAGSSATSPGGVAVTLGAAAALNTVTLGTTAVVEGSTSILSPGDLSISASGGGAIKAVSFGVAAGLRRGDGYDLSGAGSAAVNTVTTNTIAALRSAAGRAPTIGSNAQRLRAITVKAGDTSSVVAGAGGLSSIFNFGKGVEVGLSVGVSFTINKVTGTVSAGIDGASVHSSGDVTVAADYAKGQNDQNIYSVTVAGAVDASAGAGVLFPLAGSGSRNTVAMTT
ncbi:MAG: hypothetical protein EBS51_16295, partial [Planctomycetia bacterium]|nr:hypothetical protein [Planctomycetia bacterium]